MTEKDIHNIHINQPNAPTPSSDGKEAGVADAPNNLIHGKAWMIFAGLCVLAVAIIIKVFVIQLFPDESAQQLAQSFTYKVNEIEPVRGQILSSDGSLLATSVPEYEIRWDAKAEYDKEEYTAKMLLSQLYCWPPSRRPLSSANGYPCLVNILAKNVNRKFFLAQKI